MIACGLSNYTLVSQSPNNFASSNSLTVERERERGHNTG